MGKNHPVCSDMLQREYIEAFYCSNCFLIRDLLPSREKNGCLGRLTVRLTAEYKKKYNYYAQSAVRAKVIRIFCVCVCVKGPA